jgi:hypothetical protein
MSMDAPPHALDITLGLDPRALNFLVVPQEQNPRVTPEGDDRMWDNIQTQAGFRP